MAGFNYGKIGLQQFSLGTPDTGGAKYDSELVLNGGFADGTNWVLGTGWAIAAGTLNGTAGSASSADQGGIAAAVSGTTYRVAIEITSVTAGSVAVLYGGETTASFSTAGLHVQDITASTTGTLEIQKDATFAGSVDNMSIREIIR